MKMSFYKICSRKPYVSETAVIHSEYLVDKFVGLDVLIRYLHFILANGLPWLRCPEVVMLAGYMIQWFTHIHEEYVFQFHLVICILILTISI